MDTTDLSPCTHDSHLMAQVAAGDRSALAVLVTRHQRRLLVTAYRILHSWPGAEDVVQEAFLRVWKSAARYTPTAALSTWLHRILVNLCLDTLKKRRPTVMDPCELPPVLSEEDSAAADRQLAVRTAVSALPDRQRIAVVLHRYSGLTVPQIADSTGWSASAVESLLVRAYQFLRERLRQYENSYAPAAGSASAHR